MVISPLLFFQSEGSTEKLKSLSTKGMKNLAMPYPMTLCALASTLGGNCRFSVLDFRLPVIG
jgi:hypothetical protein